MNLEIRDIEKCVWRWAEKYYTHTLIVSVYYNVQWISLSATDTHEEILNYTECLSN